MPVKQNTILKPVCYADTKLKNMKKFFLIPAALMVAALSSCGGGGGLESDIRKGVKMECEIEKLENMDDEASKMKLEKLEQEKDAYDEKMMKKYAKKIMDKDFQEKAERIEEEAKKDCK